MKPAKTVSCVGDLGIMMCGYILWLLLRVRPCEYFMLIGKNPCIHVVMYVFGYARRSELTPAVMEPAETVTCVGDFDVWIYIVSAAQGYVAHVSTLYSSRRTLAHMWWNFIVPIKNKNKTFEKI